MKQIYPLLFIAALIGIFSVPQLSFATSGACSYHAGVNCVAGPGVYGQVVCNDGWDGSSVSFYSMVECEGAYSPVCRAPAPLTNVTCAANSCDITLYELKQQRLVEIAKSGGMVSESQLNGMVAQDLEDAHACCYYQQRLNQYNMCVAVQNEQRLRAQAELVTPEQCFQKRGLNSFPNGKVCVCKDNYILNKSGQCMPAGEVCIQNYGPDAIPTGAPCGCSFGHHLDAAQQQCVRDTGQTKTIPRAVKEWADANKGNIAGCQQNSAFTADDVALCIQYQSPIYNFEWKVSEPIKATTIINPDTSPKLLNDERCVKLNLGTWYNTNTQNCDTCPAGMEKDANANKCRVLSSTVITQVSSTHASKVIKEASSAQVIATTTIPALIPSIILPIAINEHPQHPQTFWVKLIGWLKFW